MLRVLVVEDNDALRGALKSGLEATGAVQAAGDANAGRAKAAVCGACHGAAAEGNPVLNSPRLAGSDDWYLLAQLNAFRAGQRGAHPEDRTGKQMRAMAGVLPNDQSVRDVVAFIRSRAE